MDSIPEGLYEYLGGNECKTRLQHLSALLHCWLMETGFTLNSLLHGLAGGRVQMCHQMHQFSTTIHLLPIAGDIVRVNAYLEGSAPLAVSESFSLSDSVRASSIVKKTTGDERFDESSTAGLKIRFRNELALPMKHRIYQEAGLAPPSDSILGLPDEILLMVIQRVRNNERTNKAVQNIVRFGGACKRINELTKDQRLWESLFARSFPQKYKQIKEAERQISDWRQEYKKAFQRSNSINEWVANAQIRPPHFGPPPRPAPVPGPGLFPGPLFPPSGPPGRFPGGPRYY